MFLGCSTSYQSKGFSGGYSESQLGPNIYKIYFKGNGYTSKEKAEDFAMLRAAELTLQNHYRYFEVIDSNAEETLSLYHNTSNKQNVLISKPGSSLNIKFSSEKFEDKKLFFDARFICDSLGRKYEIVCSESSQ